MRIAKANAILTAVRVKETIFIEEDGHPYAIAYCGDFVTFDEEENFKGVVSEKDSAEKWQVVD